MQLRVCQDDGLCNPAEGIIMADPHSLDSMAKQDKVILRVTADDSLPSDTCTVAARLVRRQPLSINPVDCAAEQSLLLSREVGRDREREKPPRSRDEARRTSVSKRSASPAPARKPAVEYAAHVRLFERWHVYKLP